MKRFCLCLLFAVACGASASWANTLGGYAYGNDTAPVGDEWNNVEKTAYNKEQPHNWFFNFETPQQALGVLPEKSPYWLSLDGTWKFKWVNTPDKRPVGFQNAGYDVSSWDDVQVPMNWNVYGIGKDGTQKYGKPIYTNTQVIFAYKREKDDWRKGVMQTPPQDWTTYVDRNEVGSYRRSFTIPQTWKGRQVFICFDGVDSFFYLWINGHYVGFSKNSRNAARFNITPYLNKKGDNVVAAEVYRNSDGSYLEAQDMFRLPGIFRTVSLYSAPDIEIRDLTAVCDMDEEMDNSILKLTTEVTNHSSKNAKDYKIIYHIYKNKLYSDAIEPDSVKYLCEAQKLPFIGAQSTSRQSQNMYTFAQDMWSAERPVRYTLVAELQNAKGKTVETVSTFVGFRKVAMRTVPASKDEFNTAGRYFYVNCQPIKLKGVNRHEHNPNTGHAINREQMEAEIMIMKRANINTVRTSHYPDDPYWYYLCDKYGLYLVAEANVESHEYGYDEASISHPVEWRNAHVDRVMEMARSYTNSPSIIMWSLGNEAGPGLNFKAAYDSLHSFDASRPIHYERNNDISDVGSKMYPSIDWVRKAVTGKSDIKYPFFICEYAHSMGNACGGLADYWKAIESTNFLMGGCIWDWVDQAIYNYDGKTGQQYMAYGGDFGDKPNDGQFVMNGLMFANFKPKPQYYEVKRVYQNVQIDSINGPQGFFTIFNKNYFTDLSNYDIVWSLWKDGRQEQQDTINLRTLPPRQRVTVHTPFNLKALDAQSEYFVKIQLLLKQDMPWAQKGYVQAEQQYLVKAAGQKAVMKNEAGQEALQVKSENDSVTNVRGAGFDVCFNNRQGTVQSLQYGSRTIIPNGCGPKVDAFRAFTNNDNWFYKSMFENGLHNLRQSVSNSKIENNADGSVTLSFTLTAQAPCISKLHGNSSDAYHSIENIEGKPDFKIEAQLHWTVFADGSIQLNSELAPNKAENVVLPRLGFVMEMPQALSLLTYYGRGPVDNYSDRKAGQNIELFSAKIDTLNNIWPKPQDTGNHEEVRWCAVTTPDGQGVLFVSPTSMSIEALPYSDLALTLAGHPYQLPPRQNNYIHLDAAVTGLGGNSCGQGGPLEEQRVAPKPHAFSLLIRPINQIPQQVDTYPGEYITQPQASKAVKPTKKRKILK